VTEPTGEARRRTVADRFACACTAVVDRLPGRLAPLIAPSLVGFVLINGFTFGVDLALLTLLHGGLAWPLWLAITLSYLTAFGLAFLLNRTLNFRSHAPLRRQTGLYLAAMAINYGAILIGIGDGLTTLGVRYQLARIIAGACEGVFMYSALRWVIFNYQTPPTHRQPHPVSNTYAVRRGNPHRDTPHTSRTDGYAAARRFP